MGEQEVALVRQALAGDRAAFDELVRRTSRLVYARLYLDVGDVHRAEDLTQETLMRAYRSLKQLGDPAGFRSWLLTIAQNVLLDSSRNSTRLKRAEPPRGDVPLALVPGGSSPEVDAQREEQRRQVLAVLRGLPEEYRLPLTLRYIAGADYESIGMQLGLTNGSLRGLLHRGLKMLRERLPAEMGE